MISVWRHWKKNGQINFFVYNGLNYPEMEESGWEMNYIRIDIIRINIILISFILPAVISLVIGNILRKINWIKENDLKLD